MPKPDPWSLTIKLIVDENVDPDHATIEVSCAHQPENGGYTYAETIAAYRWCAGILGRLSIAIAGKISKTRDEHGCRAPRACVALGIEYHPADLEYSPSLAIDFPIDHDHDEWLKDVNDNLACILEADAWQPSEEDEAEWEQ